MIYQLQILNLEILRCGPSIDLLAQDRFKVHSIGSVVPFIRHVLEQWAYMTLLIADAVTFEVGSQIICHI